MGSTEYCLRKQLCSHVTGGSGGAGVVLPHCSRKSSALTLQSAAIGLTFGEPEDMFRGRHCPTQ
eukprot:COSAG03_NODE_21726_length_300_cov_0.875622_2_plen_63_part_01